MNPLVVGAVLLIATQTFFIFVLVYLLNRHDWGPWGDWLQEKDYYSSVWWVRFKVCEHCGNTQRQKTNTHYCTTPRDCPHKPGSNVERLEKELGL